METLELLFLPHRPFLYVPELSILPATVFGWLGYRAWREGDPNSVIAALVTMSFWLGYGIYERAMQTWTDAAIRVDLLIIVPALFVATIVGLILGWPRKAVARPTENANSDDPDT